MKKILLFFRINLKLQITLYDNAIDAIKEIKTGNQDLIISDIQLPDLSGFELIKLIRDNDRLTGKTTLVIALTAHVLGEYREKCIKAGFDDYLSKPVTMVQLYQKITEKTGKRALLEDSLEKKLGSINDNIFEKLREELKTGALKSIDRIEEAFNTRNYGTIIFEAHKLKGSFGNAKENELYRMFSELEKLAKDGNEIVILEHFNRCKNHFKERFGR